MLKNYFKIALRHLQRQKLYSFINLASLAVGIACCLLILLYVQDKLAYDRHHQNAGQIYRVLLETPDYPVAPVIVSTPIVLAPKLQEAFSEIRQICRLKQLDDVVVTHGGRQFTERRFFLADPAVFKVFSFQLLRGDANTALEKPNSVILTAAAAQRYFGAADPLQQEIEVDGKGRFMVTGVMADLPPQSHFHFDFLGSLSSIGEIKNPWEHWGYTYLLLPENVPPAELEKKFPAITNYEYLGWWVQDMKFRLQPLTAIHLRSHFHSEIEANSDVRYIYIFSLVALAILLIACMNYMNLATAKFIPRAKEVGIRKVVGSRRWHLILQFVGESVLLSFFAAALALIIVELSLPAFNNLVQKQLALNDLKDARLLAGGLGLVFFTGVISGSYPAFYLSSFRPVRILKGLAATSAGAIGVRRILVLTQFAAMVSLIIGTVVAQKQLDFIRSKKLGFDKENIIVLPIRGTEIRQHLSIFKSELLGDPSIVRVSGASGGPIDGAGVISSLKNSPLQIMMADADYLPTLDIALARGRNFSPEFGADSAAFLLNETAVKLLEWKNPLEKIFTGGFGIKKGPVIGVVKDFHNKSLHAPIEPMVFQYQPRRFAKLLIKVKSENLAATLAFIKQKWEAFERVKPFEYSFLDEDLDKLYRSEQRMGKFSVSFSALAILIACLGLFGLASFTAEQRTKEIGIRKVLGASVSGVVALLSKDFVKLVLVANLIAWPIAYYAMNRWLQNFAYRIDIGWWVFALAGGLALVIALLTVSTQALKAALANPVDSLRYE